MRKVKENRRFGDTDKATNMLFHKLANDPDASLRIPIGSDSDHFMKQKLGKIEADITKYESWSDDLY